MRNLLDVLITRWYIDLCIIVECKSPHDFYKGAGRADLMILLLSLKSVMALWLIINNHYFCHCNDEKFQLLYVAVFVFVCGAKDNKSIIQGGTIEWVVVVVCCCVCVFRVALLKLRESVDYKCNWKLLLGTWGTWVVCIQKSWLVNRWLCGKNGF